MSHPPTPGTQAREQYDADHGGIDTKPEAGSDEELQFWKCPHVDRLNALCYQCKHGVDGHVYCPHETHFCLMLDKEVKCERIQ